MYYIKVTGGIKKLKKEGKMKISILIFITQSLLSFVPNFRILTQVVAQKSLP